MTDFAHRLTLDKIGDGDRLDLIADEAERAEVTHRLNLLGIERLEAHVILTRDGERISAKGRVKAALDQACVATGEPVRALIDEPFELQFVPEMTASVSVDEVELSGDELDTLFHDGQAIDLGAAIADSLALALDPYPRCAGADEALREAGVMTEEDASPFAALAALKGKLSGA